MGMPQMRYLAILAIMALGGCATPGSGDLTCAERAALIEAQRGQVPEWATQLDEIGLAILCPIPRAQP